MSGLEDDDEAAGASTLLELHHTKSRKFPWTDEESELLLQLVREHRIQFGGKFLSKGNGKWDTILRQYNQQAREKGWPNRPKKGCQCRFRLMQKNGLIPEDEDMDVDVEDYFHKDANSAASGLELPATGNTKLASGLEWVNFGSEKPATGKELFNEGLSEALQEKTKFKKAEWYIYHNELFGKGEALEMQHFIKSGDDLFRPTTEWSVWTHGYIPPRR